MRTSVCLILALAFAAPAHAADALTVVVMDPLAADLSCPCVEGYAQRQYQKLGEFIGKQLGRPVKVHFAETLEAALAKKTEGKADLIIGKDSVVRAGAKASKLDIAPVAALTGKDGKTTMTGLFIVANKDKAQTASDLAGYSILFGTADADEKYTAALALLKDLEVKVPEKLETCASCSTGATKVLEAFKNDKKCAAVISSYAQPLLEGCGTVKKGDLRVIGETDPVPFITAFVNSKLSKEERAAIQKALFAVRSDEKLCKLMETKSGFVALTDAKKK